MPIRDDLIFSLSRRGRKLLAALFLLLLLIIDFSFNSTLPPLRIHPISRKTRKTRRTRKTEGGEEEEENNKA